MLLCTCNRLPKNIIYFSLISSSALFLFLSFTFPSRNFHVVRFSRTISIALFFEQCKQSTGGCLWGMGVRGVTQLVLPELSLWTFNYILSAKSSKKRLAAHSTQRWTTVSFTRIARWTHSECGYTRWKPPLTVSSYKYKEMKTLFWAILQGKLVGGTTTIFALFHLFCVLP
jgi:hypothetical protein